MDVLFTSIEYSTKTEWSFNPELCNQAPIPRDASQANSAWHCQPAVLSKGKGSDNKREQGLSRPLHNS